MSDHTELAGIELDHLCDSSRLRLGQAASRVRLGLAELERGILEALLQEAAINLGSGILPGRDGAAPNVRRIVAAAIEARIAPLLTPYLLEDEPGACTCPNCAADELLALCDLADEDEPA